MKVLWSVKYTQDGVNGVLKEGGSSRRAVAQKLIESVGGTMEAFYFAYGKYDVFIIADVPNNEADVAASLKVAAAGGAVAHTTVLLTPEEVDRAVEQNAEYRASGA